MITPLLSNLSERYQLHINTHSRLTDEDLKRAFLEILTLTEPRDRVTKWQNLKVRISSLKQLVHLANPFFIGYGNPNSDVLFLGKEKAFNMKEEPDLFIHESVNNLLQWEMILSQKEPLDHNRLFSELGFNPMFPKLYFPGKFKKRHTWGLYSEIIRQLKGLSGEILNTKDYDQSFFRHCFLSEINYIPSRYSENRKLDDIRKKFLKTELYRSFPVVIIGAVGYLNSGDIKEIFDTTKEEELQLGSNRSRSITAKIYTSKTQKVVLCNQLSGAAGWTTEALSNLVKQCRLEEENYQDKCLIK